MKSVSATLLPVLLVLMMALGPISTDLYLPSLPDIRDYFAVDAAAVQLTLSVYLGAFALCQLVYGPLSDRYGRRPVLLCAAVIYVAASVLCMTAPTMEILVAARLLQALGGCAGVVIARAVIRDVYPPARAARIMSYAGSAMALAPALGPVLGGNLTMLFGWRACFAALAVFGALCLAGCALWLRETNSRLDPAALRPGPMLRNYRSVLTHRGSRGYLLAMTFSYSGLFAFISGSSFVFIQLLGLTADLYGYCFAAAIAGYITGAQAGARLVGKIGIRRLVLHGSLLLALAGATLMAMATANAGVIGMLVPMVLYMIGMGLTLPNAVAATVAPFPTLAGAASGISGAIQNGVAALVGMAVGAAFNATAMPMAAGVCLCGLLCWLCSHIFVRAAPDPSAQ